LHRGGKTEKQDYRKEPSREVDLVLYLSVAERILCLIFGFSSNTNSARLVALLIPVRISAAWYPFLYLNDFASDFYALRSALGSQYEVTKNEQ
jgi:hypothetical protein